MTLLQTLVDWIQLHPVIGPVAYVVVVSLWTVLFLPGSISMMVAGFLFGALAGSVWAMLGIVIGSQLALFAGRWLARPWVERRIAANDRLQAIDAAIDEEAFSIVLLTRLALLIPFNLLNYVYGATSVRPMTYLRATTAGMLPVVVLYVYIGTLARNLGEIVSGDATPSGLGYALAIAGLVAIAAATWFIHRAATRALRSRLQDT